MVVWRQIVDWVSRRFSGASPAVVFASSADAPPQDYAPAIALSSVAKFWPIWVAVAAITTDMAGVPP